MLGGSKRGAGGHQQPRCRKPTSIQPCLRKVWRRLKSSWVEERLGETQLPTSTPLRTNIGERVGRETPGRCSPACGFKTVLLSLQPWINPSVYTQNGRAGHRGRGAGAPGQCHAQNVKQPAKIQSKFPPIPALQAGLTPTPPTGAPGDTTQTVGHRAPEPRGL